LVCIIIESPLYEFLLARTYRVPEGRQKCGPRVLDITTDITTIPIDCSSKELLRLLSMQQVKQAARRVLPDFGLRMNTSEVHMGCDSFIQERTHSYGTFVRLCSRLNGNLDT